MTSGKESRKISVINVFVLILTLQRNSFYVNIKPCFTFVTELKISRNILAHCRRKQSCPLLPAMPVVRPVVIRKVCNPVSVNQAQLGHQQACGLLLSPGTGVVLMLHAQPGELG